MLNSMKIAISGKGGVGKTTLCALLARAAAADGLRVLAVDADPNPTLAPTLGYPEEIKPLTELKELIEERAGSFEGFIRLNPRVDDLPERVAVEKDGIKLLVMGPIRQGGAGCACPQNTILKNLMQHIVLERDDWVLLDFEAGLEPLGRATAQGVDVLLIVVEPEEMSLLTAGRIEKLARELGLQQILAVANKIRGTEDHQYMRERLPIKILGALPYSERLRSQREVQDPKIHQEIQGILQQLKRLSE